MDKNIIEIPFVLRGIENTIEVIYKANDSAVTSGFDAILDLTFNPEWCYGYPIMHAYIKNNKNTGYKRHCGWIQIVTNEYFSTELLNEPDNKRQSLDSSYLFYAYGYPAEIYDAPCNNLGNNYKNIWTAYTYLAEVPSRMNNHNVIFLAGFKWGYTEISTNGKPSVSMTNLTQLSGSQWNEHIDFLKLKQPDFNYQSK